MMISSPTVVSLRWVWRCCAPGICRTAEQIVVWMAPPTAQPAAVDMANWQHWACRSG